MAFPFPLVVLLLAEPAPRPPAPSDAEVIENLDLLMELELAESLEVFAPADDAPDDDALPAPADGASSPPSGVPE
ncbi:MAG: hypothetical protein ACOYM9_18965 [Bradymonadia bacterium]|jgi:hypothetical protein